MFPFNIVQRYCSSSSIQWAIQELESSCIGNCFQSKNKNTINFITGCCCLLLFPAIKCKSIKSSCITFLYHESLILYLLKLRIVGMFFLFKEDATRTTHYNKNEEFIAVAYNTLKVFLEFLGASPAAAWASYYFFFLWIFTFFYEILSYSFVFFFVQEFMQILTSIRKSILFYIKNYRIHFI